MTVILDTPARGGRKRSLAESVYDQLKRDIFEFRLLPGDRFTEGEIAQRLAVSRTPVREALQRLEKEGYLEVRFRSGWSLRPLDFRQFDHLYDLRIILETASVRHLCESEDRPSLDALKGAWLVTPEERLAAGSGVADLDEAFHASIVAAAGNPEVERCHRDVTERIRILRRLDFTEPARVAATYQEHGQILRAILRRRTEQALLLLKAHVEASKAEVRKISLHRFYLARTR
ncbi:MAG: GntR family transcriptional regulator [Betaproteobacteria bacterium]|nr:GntR family transcriptional regulator [Betaproteobacteria bacterium]